MQGFANYFASFINMHKGRGSEGVPRGIKRVFKRKCGSGKGVKMAQKRQKLCKMHKTVLRYSLKIVMKIFQNLLQFRNECCIMIELDMR